MEATSLSRVFSIALYLAFEKGDRLLFARKNSVRFGSVRENVAKTLL